MAVLAVVSDRPRAGKTAFCAALARHVQGMGMKAAVLKPVGPNDDPDAAAYANLLGQSVNGAPRLPEGAAFEQALPEILAAAKRYADQNDLLLIEVSSSLSNQDAAHLAAALDANALGIAGYRHSLQAPDVAALDDTYGGRLLGVLVNGWTRYAGHDTTHRLLPSMEQAGVRAIGAIPEDRALLGVTVDEIAERLDGRILTEIGETDTLVEHFLVGGLGLDKGVEYFGIRERKAAIVRGDRPDIQMAALQTPTSCLILTKGVSPIEYVFYEAENQEIPILLTDLDTIPAMESLANIQDRARFDHPDKLARFRQLLTDHVDVGAVLQAVGLPA